MVNEWIVLELLEAGKTYTLPGWALITGVAIGMIVTGFISWSWGYIVGLSRMERALQKAVLEVRTLVEVLNGPDGDTPAEMLPGADETIEEYTQ
jgi:hypothetical protein